MNTSSLNQTDTTTTAMQDTLTFNDMPERTERRDVIYRAPQPWLQKAEAFLERTCKFEHGANIFPFLHIVLFYMALAFLEFGVFDSLWLNVPIWIGLVLANYSLSIGIQHLHTHRKMFTVPWLNRVTEILLTLPGGVSHPVMKYIHVHLHHRYDDGEGDPTSTKGKEHGWKAVRYWIDYGYVTHKETIKGLFAKDAKPTWKRMRGQYIVDNALMVAFAVGFFLYDPQGMVMFYLIPYIIVSINIGYFAWLTHAPAREGKLNGSINNTSNWMNLFIHNQGYHSLHHVKPSIHWTAIPEHLDVMQEVDHDLIVPYWVTLDSAYRILNPDKFRDEKHGAQWKQVNAAKKHSGTHRLSAMPYFGWI